MLINPDSSIDVMFGSTFKGIKIDHHNIRSFQGSPVGCPGKQLWVMGYISLETKMGLEVSDMDIKVKYFIVYAMSPYNSILG